MLYLDVTFLFYEVIQNQQKTQEEKQIEGYLGQAVKDAGNAFYFNYSKINGDELIVSGQEILRNHQRVQRFGGHS